MSIQQRRMGLTLKNSGSPCVPDESQILRLATRWCHLKVITLSLDAASNQIHVWYLLGVLVGLVPANTQLQGDGS